MSTPAAKRPPPGRVSPNSTPARANRASTPGSGDRAGAVMPTSSLARARSVRSSTPVSARAAAAQRRESHLSISSTAKSAAALEAEEAARAETVALLDDLKARLSKAEADAEQYHRQNDVLQARLDESHQEHVKLEERTHEYDEQAEALVNEKREMARQIQQMEAIYETERSAMTREREDRANREEEMQTVIQRLKESLAQRADEEGRPSRQSNSNSPSLEGSSFAPPASLHRSDSRNNSKLLLQKDKLIESLRLELAEAQIKLVESENQGGGRLREVERQLMEARMANARLMEDNESYQLLLQEKTLKGEFSAGDNLAYPLGGGYFATIIDTPGERPLSSNQDALNALEGRDATGGSSLADELLGATADDEGRASTDGGVEYQRRLESDLKSLRDQNKAQQLYINRIIERLLEHQEYQYILDKSTDGKQPLPPQHLQPVANTDKDLPPPPPPQLQLPPQQPEPLQQQQQPGGFQSFLQRTKSMAVGGSSANRHRPRPMSMMPETALNHPETAPSIPIALGRSASVRRPARPASEQFTSGPAAATVVNAMYKGPDRPLSPTLRGSQHFFGGPAGRLSIDRARSPGASSAGGGGGPSSSGNFPGMKSETSSVSDDSVIANGGAGDSSTQPSPPRQHEKTAFTGSKPRPLRLVQENSDSVKTENKRASWIGWAFGGKKDDHAAALTSNTQSIVE